MKQNLLDRAIAAVSPKVGVQRALNKMRLSTINDIQSSAGAPQQRSDTRWRGASQSLRSLATWLPWLGSGRSDLPKAERDRLTARSQDAYRNHLVARAVVTRVRTSVVGTGLAMHPAIDGEAIGLTEEETDAKNKEIASEWRIYSENPLECDIEATLDVAGQQGLALLTAMLGGDCFALTPFKERQGCVYGLKVQLIDPARVSNISDGPDTETLQDGVELSLDGEPIAIHIRNRHPGDRFSTSKANDWVRREIFGGETGLRRIFQIWNDKDRIGTTRGAPYLAPILEPLQTLETYSRSELMAAVVSSLFTVFIKKAAEQTDERGNPLPMVEGQTTKGTASDLTMGSGAIVDLGVGEEAQFANPSRPNANYDPFFMSVVTQIGAALEVPVDELLLKYQSSYSAARAAMLQAWRFYTMRRWWLVQQFCQPLYQLWFDEAVARGRIEVQNYGDPRIRAAYTQAIWIGPARGSMDENQEANAAKTRIDMGVSNETIETAQMTGEQWSQVISQRSREIKLRKKLEIPTVAAPGQAALPNQNASGNPNEPTKDKTADPNAPPATAPAEPVPQEELA